MIEPFQLLKSTVFKLLGAIFFLLTSTYFFLAYIPYTNFFLIQAPPYPWLTWFGHHHSILYWAVLVITFVEFLDRRGQLLFRIAFALQTAMGIWLTLGSGLQKVASDWKAYAWSLAILLPFAMIHIAELRRIASSKREDAPSFSYSNALIAAAIIAIVSALSVVVWSYASAHQYAFTRDQMDLLVWMLGAHVCMAVLAVSVLNLILALYSKFSGQNSAIRRWICLDVTVVLLSIAFSRYFQGSLTFNGWQLYSFVIPFCVALSCAAASIVWPLLDAYEKRREAHPVFANTVLVALVAPFALAALCEPTLIGDADWNNIIQYSCYGTLWLAVGVAVYLVRPCKQRYTVYGMVAAMLVAGAAYGGLEFSSLAWARALGPTPADIQESVQSYAVQNGSFGMVYQTLHPEAVQRCQDLCRILRQCTNMRDTVAKRDLNLVPSLSRSEGLHPNIFLIVVDSMRPDYLGTYNPKVDFTPNLDQFARESIVMRNAFTSYAGTSLSEPSIFAGALLLHSHYPRPFRRENSLLKLAESDGYKLIVSYDPILRQVLDQSDSSVKIDTEKAWNEIELASTFQELQPFFDAQARDKRPIFLYTQPQNVHQGTSNRLLEMEREHWHYRLGFDKVTTYRVHLVDSAMGQFVADLKARGIYDNSIIVLTADHGEGLPGSVCHGHQKEICPEVLRVPLIIHLPKAMLQEVVYDDHQVATPTDIMPSLYYLLGHRPIEHNLIFGKPLFTKTREELESYRRKDVFFVSDARAAYGLLLDNAHYMYLIYDSPQRGFFYDLSVDRDGRHDIVTPEIAQRCNNRLVDYLFAIGKFYGYTPTGGRSGV